MEIPASPPPSPPIAFLHRAHNKRLWLFLLRQNTLVIADRSFITVAAQYCLFILIYFRSVINFETWLRQINMAWGGRWKITLIIVWFIGCEGSTSLFKNLIFCKCTHVCEFLKFFEGWQYILNTT